MKKALVGIALALVVALVAFALYLVQVVNVLPH